MAQHRGRHRRPSRTAKMIAPAAGITAAGAIAVMGSTGTAQARTVAHISSPSGTAVVSSAVIQTTSYTPRHSSEGVTVRPGDSLSKLAGEYCEGKTQDWTGWWNYNHKSQHWHDPNTIYVGQHVFPDCRDEQVWLPAPPPPPVTQTADVQTQQQSSSGGYQYHSSSGGSYGNIDPSSGPGGSFGDCVRSRESGGNSQVMNASQHYGLYQFSEGTWVAYGGNAADFGHASVGEQNTVFSNALAQGGESNWSPYDGC